MWLILLRTHSTHVLVCCTGHGVVSSSLRIAYLLIQCQATRDYVKIAYVRTYNVRRLFSVQPIMKDAIADVDPADPDDVMASPQESR